MLECTFAKTKSSASEKNNMFRPREAMHHEVYHRLIDIIIR